MKKYSLIKKANSRQNSSKKRVIILISFVFVVLLLFYTAPPVVRSAVYILWMPYDAVRVWVLESNDSLPVYLRARQVLDERINKLEEKLAQTNDEEETISRLEKENSEFRELLDMVPEGRVSARVLARPNQLPYDVMMLDRGSVSGMVENAPVFSGHDKLIGVITKVFENTSYATLVTTPGFSATAYVYGPNIYTITEGMGSGVLRVRVPQGIGLEIGDVVILPATDSGLFGVITRVETSPTKPEKYGYIVSDIPLQSLQYVSIGKSPVVTNDFIQSQAVVTNMATQLLLVDVPTDSLVTPETFFLSTSSDNGVTTYDVVASTSTLSTQ